MASEGADGRVVALADGGEEVEGLGAVEAETHIVAADGNICLNILACGCGHRYGLVLLVEGVSALVGA